MREKPPVSRKRLLPRSLCGEGEKVRREQRKGEGEPPLSFVPGTTAAVKQGTRKTGVARASESKRGQETDTGGGKEEEK